MKVIFAVITIFVATSSLADEKSKSLDRKLFGLLLEQSEVVVHCHRDKSGLVGMDERMKNRYGLPTEETGWGMDLKGTVIGPKVEGETIGFWCGRGVKSAPFFVGEGDYLVFLKHDTQQRWILVADYLGIQPMTLGLTELLKEIHGK